MTQTPRPQEEFREMQERMDRISNRLDHLERRDSAIVHIVRGMKKYRLLGELSNEKNRKDIIDSADVHVKEVVKEILEQEF